jgi:non-canonical purine NTP pyrophosphatase (RdgB/HAM1 family)
MLRSGDRLLVATHNRGKLEEIADLLGPYGVSVVGAGELGLPEPEETETTFIGNARLKAHAAAKAAGMIALADDSGLAVDALDGAPGVFTADWATTAHGRDFAVGMERVWRELEAINAPEPRRAQFCCTLVLAAPNGQDLVFEGKSHGRWFGPVVAPKATGLTRSSCPTVTPRPSARWTAGKRTACPTEPTPSQACCSPVPVMDDWRNAGFGLYLHWPFCQSKCPYCDFNSHVAARVDQSRWLAAFEAEIDRIGALTKGRVLNTVFFGGGTPSLMEAATVQGILDRVRATWTLANDVEITLEANPGSVEAGRFEGYARAGVNRVSLGIQSLDPDDLRRLGRMHSVDEARAAIGVAQSVFDRVSIDLIYARQDQTLAPGATSCCARWTSARRTCRCTS